MHRDQTSCLFTTTEEIDGVLFVKEISSRGGMESGTLEKKNRPGVQVIESSSMVYLPLSKSRRFQPYPSTNKTRHNRCKQVLGNIRDTVEERDKRSDNPSFVFPLDSLGYYWLYISL